MKHVKGPDLPTGAEIISPRSDLKAIYEQGTGSFKARATYEIEEGNVVITAFPFQVSGSRVQEQIRQGKNQADVGKFMTAEYKWAPDSLNMQWSLPGMMTELK